MTFLDLGLEPELQSSIDKLGFTTPTPIQVQCFEPGTSGRSLVGISQTGTGKTLAFLLPILNNIYKQKIDTPYSLILAPTRELCVQISEELQRLSKNSPIRIATIYGGEGYNRQEKELSQNPHFIVATPGRLIDFMKQKRIPAQSIQTLVLDEADRMFDMGFIRDIRYVMKQIPKDAQIMLFTATMSYYILRLINDFMNDPVHIQIDTDRVEVEKIQQSLYHLSIDEKTPYLVNLIRSVPNIKAIVFTNSRHRVQEIAKTLCHYGIAATGLSSLLDQKKRIHLLKSFKLGKYSVLVATDVASRGLDIDDITHVYNFDLPQDAESYVHRIGRTARAGKEGIAVSFCSELDYDCLPRIELLISHKIPVEVVNADLLVLPEPSPVTLPVEDRVIQKKQRQQSKKSHKQKFQADKTQPSHSKQGNHNKSKNNNRNQNQNRQSRSEYQRNRHSQTSRNQNRHRHNRTQPVKKPTLWQRILGFFKRKPTP
ncbi:MAG: DEAD/DEAH box helicase [Leptonema sp. (in: Bacteria)]|nr:DEAD/DEAH box helicase [Leptonema sp. (in: bacteria)]